MTDIKDHLLNGLLAAMVITSLTLSSQVWFPPVATGTLGAKEARVQSSPLVSGRSMPDVLRPERILLRREENQIASLQVDSIPYKLAWFRARTIFGDFFPGSGPILINEAEMPNLVDTRSITLALPVPVTIGEWASIWHWNTAGWENAGERIDRVIFYLGESPTIYFMGPSGTLFRFGPLAQDDRRLLNGMVRDLDSAEFIQHRVVKAKNIASKILPGVLVPESKSMPRARLSVKMPDGSTEEARFFPDLSVVRYIDEKDAQSYTDGRRLLRLQSTGLLEYRASEPISSTPALDRSLLIARDWVGTRGGWPQELVVTRFEARSGKAKIQFDYRESGPGAYPIESAGGWMQLEVTDEQIAYFKRYPEFQSLNFSSQDKVSIISPEQALETAAEEVTLLLYESVRDMHLAYQVQMPTQSPNDQWSIEPVWVLRVGEARIYMPADASLEKRTPLLVR